MPRAVDLTGQRFGRLVAIEFCGRGNSGGSYWRCRCDCGSEKTTRANALLDGRTKSCGCLHRDNTIARNTAQKLKHGMSKTRIYGLYMQMIARCHEPTSKNYGDYGARGIVVCDRWRESFANFYADMSSRPAGTTLDRIDNDGPYSPDNCRWADLITQANNKRTSRFLTLDGRTQTVAQWARETGLNQGTLKSRLAKGWTTEDALTKKVRGIFHLAQHL